MTPLVEPASFRDPNGFVFSRGDILYRAVQSGYQVHYNRLMDSGLYHSLVEAGLLIAHDEEPPGIELIDIELPGATRPYRVLRPERIPFISYPYEWCFSQLRDAALATLRIQAEALDRGMWLKDASAYNIQFRGGKPILIDTLSFEIYEEGTPWPAYRQFCQHFLAPLALMARTDIRLGQLLRVYIDGIPLDLASHLLPGTTKIDVGLLTHIHAHAAAQKKFEGKAVGGNGAQARFGKTAILGLIDSLQGTVRKLAWKTAGTIWADYYSETNYSDQAMAAKKRLVQEMLCAVEPEPRIVWDLGANTGEFSRIASGAGALALAWDVDPGAVEKNYLACRETGETRILPLLCDLTNPSPDLGWALKERKSIVERGPADAILALALVHHLAIGNNVPLSRISELFRSLGQWLIVEFVPKTDSQVKRLLASREDIFDRYTREDFQADFSAYYEIVRAESVPDSERTLYLMRGRSGVRSGSNL